MAAIQNMTCVGEGMCSVIILLLSGAAVWNVTSSGEGYISLNL